jgi:hypothetical protein
MVLTLLRTSSRSFITTTNRTYCMRISA